MSHAPDLPSTARFGVLQVGVITETPWRHRALGAGG